MHTTVILITHQSERVLGSCLDNLFGLPDLSMLVVDNASTDGTRAVAQARGVRLLARDHNTGFAAAANFGARHADGELLCFLNPDCLLTAETLAAARTCLADRPLACATPDFVQDDAVLPGRQPGYTWRKVLADLAENNQRWPGLVQRWRNARPATWHWPLGTCLFVPAETFRALGGFDESYFLYMEDVDFGWRLHQAGGEVLALGTRVTHLGQQGSSLDLAARLARLNEARIQFARRHYGPLVGVLARRLARP